MPKRLSAGLLLFRRSARGLEVLLAHPGGPFFAKKDRGAWSIPKGEPAEGESLLAAAHREFREETGFEAKGLELPLGQITQKGGKVVHAWAVRGDADPRTLRSNTFMLEWPPGSGKKREFPEVDRVGWFSLDEARKRVKEAQVPLLDALDALVKANAK
ncbi:MAG TPA: NUDIX domain-containing protein [Myxococcota bacterium]|nr:NUDIX domain-containing protein [Myxococcota bacterium]